MQISKKRLDRVREESYRAGMDAGRRLEGQEQAQKLRKDRAERAESYHRWITTQKVEAMQALTQAVVTLGGCVREFK